VLNASEAAPAPKVIEDCRCHDGVRRRLVHLGSPVLSEKADAAYVALTDVAVCANHCKKLWVIAVVDQGPVDADTLRQLAIENDLANFPFFIGRVTGLNEILVLYRAGESERHKSKKLHTPGRAACFAFSAGGAVKVKLMKTVMQAVQSCDLKFASIEVREVTAGECELMSMEEANAMTEELSAVEFAAAVGNARLIEAAERSPLQTVLVKCETQLKAMRARSERARMLLREVGLENPRPIPLKDYVGLEFLVGTSRDPTTGAPVTASFAAFLKQPELHLRYSAVLLGRAGLGKTPLAISFCSYAAVAYQGHHYGTPADKASFIVANTIDMLKECTTSGQWRPYTPLFLDEFEAADARQQGIVGENSLKILVDVQSGGTLRARYHDVAIPPACPRIFASNVGSVDEWLQHLGCHEEHRAAILKRTMFFHVRASVLPPALRGSTQTAIEITPGLRASLEAALAGM
jgi:hypothetical protein